MTAIALLATGCGNSPAPDKEYVIVVHGGAGEMGDQADNPEIAGRYYAAIDTALNIGRSVLDAGGNGTEAVKAVIRYFESNPLFNAGVGATISAEGYFELDAAIMEGKDLSAGAVAGVRHVKHPIDAAYAVKTASPHVMLSGTGADRFAEEQGLETVEDNSYFATPRTMKWVKEFQAKSKKNGTVGCVVLDSEGNLTAGTSTGGMFGKKWGRIGDTTESQSPAPATVSISSATPWHSTSTPDINSSVRALRMPLTTSSSMNSTARRATEALSPSTRKETSPCLSTAAECTADTFIKKRPPEKSSRATASPKK